MDQTPQLRRAGADDISALNALMHASSAYDGNYRAILEGYFISEDQAARDLIVVAEAAGVPQGFYSLIVGDEPELDLMFVADAAQGRDLGRLLFDDMRARARSLGLGRVKIVSHPPAVGFYQRMGAIQIGATEPAGRVTWSRPILELVP